MDRKRRAVKKEIFDPSDDDGARAPKQAASPAQEATRAQIISLESQMSKLNKLKNDGKVDEKADFQIRCLEEELKKAQSKLRRLLNEAERQRRRRERLRGGGLIKNNSRHQSTDDGVMSALKSCNRFQDFVKELNCLGYNLTPSNENGEIDLEENHLPAVEVELIEGEEEFAPQIKTEYCSPLPEVSVESLNEDTKEQEPWRGESYRQWYERQTELQQRWEENFMREQMELTRSMLESVTSTFLQGVQQIVNNLHSGRRFPPLIPDPPM